MEPHLFKARGISARMRSSSSMSGISWCWASGATTGCNLVGLRGRGAAFSGWVKGRSKIGIFSPESSRSNSASTSPELSAETKKNRLCYLKLTDVYSLLIDVFYHQCTRLAVSTLVDGSEAEKKVVWRIPLTWVKPADMLPCHFLLLVCGGGLTLPPSVDFGDAWWQKEG